MALIGNYSLVNKSLARWTTSGSAANNGADGNLRASFGKASLLRARDNFWSAKTSRPAGYTPGKAFILARSSGGLASHTTNSAEFSETDVNLALGIPIDANLSASISVSNALLALIVSLEAAISAGITLTDAQLAQVLFLEASFSASGSITNADIVTLVALAASLNASMSISNSITTLVNLSADIGGPAELSPEGLANAVWDTILAEHTDTGTTGAALADAGGAGNPWSALLADNNDPDTFGERIQKLLTVAKFLGLK